MKKKQEEMDWKEAVNYIVIHLKELFDLRKWRIVIKFGPLDSRAIQDQDSTYRDVRITFDLTKFDDIDELISTVRHEMIHLLFSPFDDVHKQLKQGLDEENGIFFHGSYINAEEKTLNNFEYILDTIDSDLSIKNLKKAILKYGD